MRRSNRYVVDHHGRDKKFFEFFGIIVITIVFVFVSCSHPNNVTMNTGNNINNGIEIAPSSKIVHSESHAWQTDVERIENTGDYQHQHMTTTKKTNTMHNSPTSPTNTMFLTNTVYPKAKTKPLIVIHAGPPKTGSTFLQNTLASGPSRNTLSKDNYFFIGGCNIDTNRKQEEWYKKSCLNTMEQIFLDNGEPIPKLKDFLQQMKDENKNALYVLEYARLFFGGMATLMDDFDIRIVVTYRRLYEWLPSAWSEEMKANHFSDTTNSKRVIPKPFYYKGNNPQPAQNVINEADRLIGKGNYSLEVIDMHAKHDGIDKKSNNLLVELFCTGAVPNALHTCQAAKEDQLTQADINSNTRLEDHFQILAYKAHQLGILKRNRLPNVDQVFQLKTCLSKDQAALSALPKVCMSDDVLEKLYRTSWKHELMFFPNRSEENHLAAFEEYRDKGHFCSIDVDAWLSSVEWQGKISACL